MTSRIGITELYYDIFKLHESEIEINRVQDQNHTHLELVREEITLPDGVREILSVSAEGSLFKIRKVNRKEYTDLRIIKHLISLACISVHSIRHHL